jgi:hypothetical protein
MHAIELDAKIEGQSIRLPATADLPTGKNARVVLRFDSETTPDASKPTDGPIARLMRHPIVVPGFKPLSRDEAHER